MLDRISPEQRSRVMARVRGKDTGPEVLVRKAAHALGLRFRLHRKDLPGTPDLVFPKWRVVLFVNGCFWHRHPGCERARMPQSRTDYWTKKLHRNVERDREVHAALRKLGWKIVVVWECETRNAVRLASMLKRKVLLRRPAGKKLPVGRIQ